MSELELEERFKKRLEEKFGGDITELTIQRRRRLWLTVKPERLVDMMRFLCSEMEFNHLATITGMDLGENLAAFYHATDQHNIITVRALTPRANPAGRSAPGTDCGESRPVPSLPTVRDVFPGTESYERELEDLFGIKIEGLPPGRHYPLPDDFPPGQHPLRKDWKLTDAYPEPAVKEAK
ncbi:MAG: NADH dehydrogenase (ubiquinone) 30 kDa subunit [Elusimicrobia bacterium]|nr:MAG: NADH dehydrogenase (ubiquinone) 30 kDa subunit [Elusimicrobiota bacterium]KAF0155412.1 MAG: NADH dehydrogenase (ubiquinone) 30 kDa subunit [Elusimicrobiota bacterium]